MNTLHKQLKFLLSHGWQLVGVNMVRSPDGTIVTDQIEKAARAWEAKLKARSLLEKNKSKKKIKFWLMLVSSLPLLFLK